MLACAVFTLPQRASGQEVRRLRSDLESILGSFQSRGATWGVLVTSIDQGDTLFAVGPDSALAPASNLKLLTTAAALRELGPEFRFQTFLLTEGVVENGVLHGDLVVYGTGDPGISDRFYFEKDGVFHLLVDQLSDVGIHSITGDLIADASHLPGPLRPDGWDPADLNDHFAAGISALSYNENVVSFRVVAAGRGGEPPELHTVPPNAGLDVENVAETVAGSARPRLAILREDPLETIRIQGRITRGSRDVWRQMTVPRPAHFAASAFLAVLDERGIQLGGGIEVVNDPTESIVGRLNVPSDADRRRTRILARHTSPALREYLAVINKRSNNLFAELVFRTLGRVRDGLRSPNSSEQAVKESLANIGVPVDDLVLLDGSDVYNASHLFGLFSTFPADAAKSTELLRGGYPAQYGGRLSSVLNVITDEGNKEEFEGAGGISFLASRLTLQGPVGRGSWLVSSRRTHLDPLISVARKAIDTQRFGYHFYDLQGKTHQVRSHNDQFTLAGYTGQDGLTYRFDEFDFDLEWGNRTISSKWTHVFDSNLFGNFLFTGSRFKAATTFNAEDTTLEETNRLTDLSLKGDISYLPTQKHSIQFGFLSKRMSMEYRFGEADQNWLDIDVEGLHSALYAQDSWALTNRLRIQPGLRFNHFSNGNHTGWSPRVAARYQLGVDTYLKAATGIYHQYIFRLAREFQGISLLSNVWALTDSTAKPSRSVHYVSGLETRVKEIHVDIEMYYKDYDGLYELNYDEQQSVEIGDILRRGDGRAYGLDLLLRKRAGRQTGWISVSTGITERIIDGLHLDESSRPQPFRSKFDRRLTLHVIHSWRFAERWTLGSRFTQASGQPYTQVFGTGEIELPSGLRWSFQDRGELNAERLPEYQRFDTSLAHQFIFRGWDMRAYLQIVNVTNHKNVFNYFWTDGTAHKSKPGTRKEISMLPILPSLGIDFTF